MCAFSALLHEMASGAPAFRGEGAERNRAILHEQLIPLKPAAGAREAAGGCARHRHGRIDRERRYRAAPA
jgi:hypothetical protein